MLQEVMAENPEIEAIFASEEFILKNPAIRKFGQLLFPSAVSKIQAAGTLVSNKEGIAVLKKPNNPFSGPNHDFLVLDQINDPGNLGTILRTADWFGFSEIICAEGTVDAFNPKVVNASRGSIFRMKVHYLPVEMILQFLKQQKSAQLYVADMKGSPIREMNWGKQNAFILGNEANGVSEAFLQLAPKKVCIPKLGGGESLNVAIASAIICEQLANR